MGTVMFTEAPTETFMSHGTTSPTCVVGPLRMSGHRERVRVAPQEYADGVVEGPDKVRLILVTVVSVSKPAQVGRVWKRVIALVQAGSVEPCF